MKSFSVKEHVPKSGAAPFEIPALLSIYVFYGIYILIHDWICYFGKLDTSIVTYAVALAVFAVVVVIFAVWNRKSRSIQFTEPEFSRWDLLVFAVFLFLFFIRVGRADVSCDTFNYHLLHQEVPFADFVTDSFFPGRRESFFPALADRMYYPFRLLLGYRMGTILYTLLMMLTYLELKRLLFCCLPNTEEHTQRKNVLVTVACGALLISNFIGHEICSYHVDIFPIPLLLYILSSVVSGAETDHRGDPFLALCVGFVVAIKLSYAFLLVPLGLLFLWENRRRLRPGLFLLFVILGILPVGVYMLNAWCQTGNPVYPLFNTIFHSPYLTDQTNEIMNGGGPSGFLDGLVRPFCWAFQSSESGYIVHSDGRLTLGFVSALILVLLPVGSDAAKRTIRRLAMMQIIMVYMNVFFVDAYPRLTLAIEPINGALVLLLVYRFWTGVSCRTAQRIAAVLLSGALFGSVTYAGACLLLGHYEYSWEYPLYLSSGDKTRKGYPMLFRDRTCSQEELDYTNKVRVWLSFDPDGGLMYLLNKKAPVISVNYAMGDEYRHAQMDALLEQHGTEEMYTLASWGNIAEVMRGMTSAGFQISGTPDTFRPYCSNYREYLIPIKRGTSGNEYFSLSDSAPVYQQEIAEDISIHTLTGYAGLDSMIETWNVDFQPITLRFKLHSDEADTVLAETTVEPDFQYHDFFLPCSVQAKAGDTLTVEAFTPDGKLYGYYIDLINISVS